MHLPALAALALVFLASCVSTSSVRLGSNHYPAADRRAPVTVYEALSDIDAHVVKVGIVQAEAGNGTSWTRMVECLQTEARSLGANAIVLAHEDDRDATTTTSWFDFLRGQQRTFSVDRMSALAVRIHAGAKPVAISSSLDAE
ncbi:MAG: hypothetical protein AAF957_07875 [Planctomycetota bacterium]